MARLWTWTGRGGGDQTLLRTQFEGWGYYSGQEPNFANVAAMGGNCLDLVTINGPYVYKSLSARSDIYIGFRTMRRAIDTGGRLLAFLSGSTCLGTLCGYGMGTAANPFPSLGAYRGESSTWLGGAILDWNYPYYVEVYYKADPTAGRWIVKLNGRQVIDYTGQTVPASQTTFDTVVFGTKNGVSTTAWYVNDIVFDDANWPGVVTFDHLVVNGSGNLAQWSPSTAPNDGCVDETPPSMSDYNATNSADQTDSFATENLPAEADVVKSVSVRAFILKENAPTPTQVKALVRTGGTPTDYVGDGKTAGVYITEALKVWENNPYTSAGWTVEEVNGMEIGYKSAA